MYYLDEGMGFEGGVRGWDIIWGTSFLIVSLSTRLQRSFYALL